MSTTKQVVSGEKDDAKIAWFYLGLAKNLDYYIGARGALFFKDGAKDIPGVCPVNCAASKTLCGVCLSDQVPGNIAFGATGTAALDYDRMRKISNEDNWRESGRPDPPDDIYNLDIGAGLFSKVMAGEIKNQDDLKSEMCKAVKKGVDSGVLAKKDCPPCGNKAK